MTAIKAAALDGFLRRPDPAVVVLLIYGEEPGAVRAMAARAVQRIAGSTDDPFSVMQINDSDLGADPTRLLDEVQSFSMLGGRRAIWVKGAGENFLKAVTPVLAGSGEGNLVIAEAGILAKSSPLRQTFEKHPRAMIVPLYEADSRDIAALISETLSRHGLSITPEARHRFTEIAGHARGLVQQELEKLALYSMGQPAVTLADVEAVCGSGNGLEADDLIDAVFAGDMGEADRLFGFLLAAGNDAGRLVSAALAHVTRLIDVRVAADKGSAVEMVLKTIRPPVFFKRQNILKKQLAVWSLAALMQAASTLAAAVMQVRLSPAIGDSIASRALLGIARNARALQADRI